jgi:hypothetical protein
MIKASLTSGSISLKLILVKYIITWIFINESKGNLPNSDFAAILQAVFSGLKLTYKTYYELTHIETFLPKMMCLKKYYFYLIYSELQK